MNIAIIGAGAVARTFMTLLASPSSALGDNNIHLSVCYIFNSKGGVHDPEGIDPDLFHRDYDISKHPSYRAGLLPIHMAPGGVDLVIDLKSTDLDAAKRDFDLCMHFIENKIHVVCGNKGPVVYGYKRLNQAAKKNGVKFACGCAACAALPSIIVGKDAHAGSKITGFDGIVNGTTNYILSKMEAGLSYEQALGQAKDEGIAEKNPEYDTSGLDTAIKTVMLANVIWDMEIGLTDAAVAGIDKLTLEDIQKARMNGEKIKLVGKAWMDENGVPQVVIAPEAIPQGHLLYATDEKFKAIVFHSENLGSILISGASSLKGAASAILRDVVNIYEAFNPAGPH